MIPSQLAVKLFNAPVALLPGAADQAVALLQATAGPTAFGIEIDADKSESNVEQCYDLVAGVAVIPIRGILVQRLGWLWRYGPMLGVSGYDRIRYQVIQALADPDVDAIALDVDSPGGPVSGCFDLADTIYRGRSVKPIWAILGEDAYSAAYAIASAATRLIVPRTGGTGSIGVIYMHVSFEDMLKKAGIDVTLVTKGAFKDDTSEFKALSADAFARLKADVLTVGKLFDATVARNRGMQAKAVAATEAGTYLGADGVKIGLADAVMAPDEAFRSLLDELG